MKHTLTILTALLIAFASHAIAAVSVTEFGAKGDGITDDKGRYPVPVPGQWTEL